MINIDKVSKSYGKDQVLDEVGLSIDQGKFTAFIGSNGAGKSTLLSLISRLMPKEEGYLYIKGQEIESWDSLNLAKELSMLKQKVDYQVKLTVEELISLWPLSIQSREIVNRRLSKNRSGNYLYEPRFFTKKTH